MTFDKNPVNLRIHENLLEKRSSRLETGSLNCYSFQTIMSYILGVNKDVEERTLPSTEILSLCTETMGHIMGRKSDGIS